MLRYLFLAALFYVLTPGVFLSLPTGGSKQAMAITHAIVFAALYYLLTKLAKTPKYMKEKFQDEDEYYEGEYYDSDDEDDEDDDDSEDDGYNYAY